MSIEFAFCFVIAIHHSMLCDVLYVDCDRNLLIK